MSDDSKRRRGQPSRYLNGGANALARAPNKPGDEVQGGWTREQLVRMDHRYVAAVEAAFRSGFESPASASAVERPGAGESRQALDSKLILRLVRPTPRSPPRLALALPNFPTPIVVDDGPS
jgi:hypothetical protein